MSVELERFVRERAESYGALRQSAITAVALDKAADQLQRYREALEAQGWQPIETHSGCAAVLVSRPTTEREAWSATSAFMDATNVWRVFRSKGGMTPLPFKPTHWQPLPFPPLQEPKP